MKKKKLIIVTGGTGRFGKILKQKNYKNFIYPTKFDLDILNLNKIEKYLKKKKPKILIHLAGISRPMKIHDLEIEKSISLNIKGTCNLVIACKKLNIKLIYFSTNYVYPGEKGNYKEQDPVLPWNNYAWSKLGGECAVRMYRNSLILRVSMTEKPFVHKEALCDVKVNFIYYEEVANILTKILNKQGILNIGGRSQSVYNFAKKDNPKIKKIYSYKIKDFKYPKNLSMNISSLKKIIK
jgi:dTDP-4-dehydrorhamnose reductase